MKLAIAWLFLSLVLVKPTCAGPHADIASFAALPVMHQGRVKPLDTVARSSLLMIRGKQSVPVEGRTIGAAEWLLDVLARPEAADTYPVFEIDDPDVLAVFGIGADKGRYFAFKQLKPAFKEFASQVDDAEAAEASQRTRFQRDVVNLGGRLSMYQSFKNTLQPAGAEDFAADVQAYEEAVGRDKKLGMALHEYFIRWEAMSKNAAFQALPPVASENPDEWSTLGEILMGAAAGGDLHPGISFYARMMSAWRHGDDEAFDAALAGYRRWLAAEHPAMEQKAFREASFNRAQPFTWGMAFYLAACLCVFVSWFSGHRGLEKGALALLLAGFTFHSAGLGLRIMLQGRPPVTNLYSSAVFVGWMGALLGIIGERRFRGGLAALASGMMGFTTLIIAYHLSFQGDTMEMMRAVLDSNFWLATHVVAVTIGYSSCFLAGLLAHIYIFRGVLTPTLDKNTASTLAKMTYAVVCFSLFFSFVGTVLGGIWADQSWGRFWGWDPKENGALLIVLWNAIILHARWAGYIRDRGLMLMAVFGAVVTSLSWFGVNMLGIGLHSYGFMDKAFAALATFIVVELLIIAMGLLPLKRWRSRAAF